MLIPKSIICWREGYSWNQFRHDAAAGIVVGLVALPLAMAFAIAAGLPPERGLYTAVVAGFLISALGGSRVQIGGPTGAFVVIVAAIVAQHGVDGLVLATIMAGVILILMGVTRLGEMVKYIPFPVTTGFTSGIAVVIFSSQLRDAFGLSMAHMPSAPWAQWVACWKAVTSFNGWAFGITVFTAALIAAWPKRWQRVPASVVALTVTSLAAAVMNLPVETIGSRFGSIPHSLPTFHWPAWSWSSVQPLFMSATTIAILGAIESLLSAVVADSMTGGRHKSSTELIAQGIANIASPLFGGMPATGAIARTATNVRNGGRTPVAGMIHAGVLLLVLLVAGPWAVHIPLASLAGILAVVCWHMAEIRSFGFVLQGPVSDRVVLLTTFLLTIFVNLTVAVEVGIVMAALLFMRTIADLTQVRSVTREAANGDHPMTGAIPSGVEVYTIHGSFFFGAAHKVLEVGRIMSRAPKALVLDMTDVLYLDASGLNVLRQIRKECEKRGTRFLLAGVHAQPLVVLEEADSIRRIGPDNVKSSIAEAISAVGS